MRYFTRKRDNMGPFRANISLEARYSKVSTQFGKLYVVANASRRLVCVAFDCQGTAPSNWENAQELLKRCGYHKVSLERGSDSSAWTYEGKSQLIQYFAGNRKTLDAKLEYISGSVMQRKIWDVLRKDVGYGQQTTYGDLAKQLNLPPTAARAIGRAMASNLLPIFVPCHRVLGKAGDLRGFAGGVPFKKSLLALEKGQTM